MGPPLRSPASDGRVELLGTHARVDPHPERPRRREGSVRRDRSTKVRPLAEPSRVVDGDDTQGQELPDDRDERRGDVVSVGRRDMSCDHARRCLVEDAGCLSVRIPPDDAPIRVRRALIDPRDGQRCPAGEERVVVVRPDGRQAAWRRALEIVSRGPPAQRVSVPAGALDPLIRVPPDVHRRSDPVDQGIDRVRPFQLDPGPCQRRLREVQVGIGQARDRHLVGRQPESSGPRVQGRRCLVNRPGRDHAPVVDRDRLGPAGPRVSGQGGNPPGNDQAAPRHGPIRPRTDRLAQGPLEATSLRASPACSHPAPFRPPPRAPHWRP